VLNEVKVGILPLAVGPWPWVPSGPVFSGKDLFSALRQKRDIGGMLVEAGASGSYTGETTLSVLVTVVNKSRNRKIDYTSWAGDEIVLGRNAPKLVDEFGNGYKLIRRGVGARPAFGVESAALGPDEGVADILLFEPPIKTAKSLVLELPQAAFGFGGKPARFRIATADITRK
jgi:hypothetical protein